MASYKAISSNQMAIHYERCAGPLMIIKKLHINFRISTSWVQLAISDTEIYSVNNLFTMT